MNDYVQCAECRMWLKPDDAVEFHDHGNVTYTHIQVCSVRYASTRTSGVVVEIPSKGITFTVR